MGRSPGFGSTTYNYFALLRLGFPTAPYLKYLTSLHIVTRWPVLQKVRGRSYIELPLLIDIGFQVLFHSPPGVLFTFPSRYFFSIGHQVVFSLGGWSPLLPTGFHVSRGTLDLGWKSSCFAYRTFTFYGGPFQTSSATIPLPLCRSSTPAKLPSLVWALPCSLAATWGIEFSFSSSGYLDVSVPLVCLHIPMYSVYDT